jgi:hypothetical protein
MATNATPAASAGRPIKPKDVVQVRQFAEAVHWIYARVLHVDDAGILVDIDHPGNSEHGLRKLVDRENLRTKDDVQALLDLADTHHRQKGVKQAVRVLTTADPWIEWAMRPDEKGKRPGEESLHKMHGNKPGIVVHYETQLKRFGGQK